MKAPTTLGLAALTALVAGAAFAVLAVPSPSFARDPSECRPSGPVVRGDGRRQADRWTLDAQATLTARVCRAGELRLDVSGVAAGGAGPTALVSWNSTLLAQREVRGATRLRVVVPGPGTVTLAFPNDYFRSNDRNLILEAVRFDPPCTSSSPRVDPSVGTWNGEGGGLHSRGAVTFETCGPGTLVVRAVGEVAGGQGPIMAVRQGARTLLEREVRAPRTFKVRVPARGAVGIHFENDYLAPPDDRRLDVNGWTFVPTAPPTP